MTKTVLENLVCVIKKLKVISRDHIVLNFKWNWKYQLTAGHAQTQAKEQMVKGMDGFRLIKHKQDA